MKGNAIPQDDHVVRYVGGQHVERDINDQPVMLGSGFIARPRDANNVSCNWLDCFGGSLTEQVQQVRDVARVKYGARGRLGRLNVGQVVRQIEAGTDGRREVEIIHDPLDAQGDWLPDPSHALMTNVPDENDPEGELIGDLIALCVLESFPARVN